MNKLTELDEGEDISIWDMKWRCMINTSLGRPEPFKAELVALARQNGDRVFSIVYIFGTQKGDGYLEFKEIDKTNSNYERYKRKLNVDYDSQTSGEALARFANSRNRFMMGAGLSRF